LLIFFFIQSKQSVSPLNILPCFQASGVSSSKKKEKKENFNYCSKNASKNKNIVLYINFVNLTFVFWLHR
jgi:hypothetical protein